ncbi:glycosyltransferase [Candidatus Enterococcus mansonii]|uniref:Glycosyltransferase 2-like domain-containing protein n=1 Tax=Candidatus Enterococcus mansonii TaxID=1834181 RepID=A0ABU8ID37_9ENTE
MKLTIVVIAYNRGESLERLLFSLSQAYYDREANLVISIDKSNDSNVIDIAKKFNWGFGNKEIIVHKKNLGLREHVLFCGQLTSKYGNICVFEDDLFVSKNYFEYAIQVIEKYGDNELIAGFSLYSHKKNIENNLPFIPLKNNSDVYLLQYAMSWGQIWTERQWKNFFEWYSKNKDISFENKVIPKHLSKWPDSSWLKYHIYFCIMEKKYFVYPYTSLSTNFGDLGTHAKFKDSSFQVELEFSDTPKVFKLNEIGILQRYDAFFESVNLKSYFKQTEYSDIEVDLYGEKREHRSSYLLSSKKLDYKIIKCYGLELKPHELNIEYDVTGKYLKLYDLKNIQKNKEKEYMLTYQKATYYFGKLKFSILRNMVIQKVIDKIRR